MRWFMKLERKKKNASPVAASKTEDRESPLKRADREWEKKKKKKIRETTASAWINNTIWMVYKSGKKRLEKRENTAIRVSWITTQ